MAGVFLRINVSGMDKIGANLKARASKAIDLRPAFDAIADDFAQREKVLFNRGGSVSGFRKWAPLSKAYRERKVAAGYPADTLVRTGALRASLSVRSHPYFVYRATRSWMKIGTSVPYASYHQTGTRRMPAREPIRITDTQRKTWAKIIERHIFGRTSKDPSVSLEA